MWSSSDMLAVATDDDDESRLLLLFFLCPGLGGSGEVALAMVRLGVRVAMYDARTGRSDGVNRGRAL